MKKTQKSMDVQPRKKINIISRLTQYVIDFAGINENPDIVNKRRKAKAKCFVSLTTLISISIVICSLIFIAVAWTQAFLCHPVVNTSKLDSTFCRAIYALDKSVFLTMWNLSIIALILMVVVSGIAIATLGDKLQMSISTLKTLIEKKGRREYRRIDKEDRTKSNLIY